MSGLRRPSQYWVFNVPEAVLTVAGRSGWKIGSGSGSGGVKVLLCAGQNVEVGGKFVIEEVSQQSS
jgi:hypothetical protein